MDEKLKEIMGESYKEDMTSDDIQAFFKNQVLGTGEYVNKAASEAQKRELENKLKAANDTIKSKMSDDERKTADSQAQADKIAELERMLAEQNQNTNILKALSLTSKARITSGLEEEDKDFADFLKNVVSEDSEKTTKIANYINTLVQKAFEKGKTEATKSELGNMGKMKAGNSNGDSADKTMAETLAEQLANMAYKQNKKESSYFK